MSLSGVSGAIVLDSAGLSSAEAAARLQRNGGNEITRRKQAGVLRLVFEQFRSPIVLLLLVATALSALVGEALDAVVIAAVVIVNAAVGFVQEFRAARAIEALQAMTAPQARVLRDGHSTIVPAKDIVDGDLLLFEAGDVVAADARLTEAHALLANEASLTGESVTVNKGTAPSKPGAATAERSDWMFLGTAVAKGTGRAVVQQTGMKTELGKIASLLTQEVAQATPLQKRLAKVSKTLIYCCGGIVIGVAGLGLLRGRPWMEVLASAISLAIAAVPEGLAAIVTVALALGVRRMAARHVLVRKMDAVETLGCTTVICTDKTGTLTTGVMRVRELWGANKTRLLDAAAACCDAELRSDGLTGVGDPMELAILARAAEANILRPEIETLRPRVAETPFDADRKCMSVQRADGVLYLKGAIEVVRELCLSVPPDLSAVNDRMVERGLRVLAVAVGTTAYERELEWLGLIGLADPPRPEAIAAIKEAHAAGIATVMITGDHAGTALAIARELGLLSAKERPADFVHARATAEDKLRIVKAWQQRGAIVAMTGDGVNDAPALLAAEIGIAMGKTGTEVTREASDMILADDNFASIIAAVKEGRGIFENIRKTLVYLLAGNAGELALMFVAAAIGLPVPLLPLHLLWINLVTDGLPALALVSDPVDADVMRAPPRRPDAPMLGRAQWWTIVWRGALAASVALSAFVWMLRTREVAQAQDVAFCVLVFGELFRSFAARHPNKTFWQVGIFSNWKLLATIGVSAALQVGIHYIPFMQRALVLSPLSWSDWALCVGLGLFPVTVIELSKLVRALVIHRREAQA